MFIVGRVNKKMKIFSRWGGSIAFKETFLSGKSDRRLYSPSNRPEIIANIPVVGYIIQEEACIGQIEGLAKFNSPHLQRYYR